MAIEGEKVEEGVERESEVPKKETLDPKGKGKVPMEDVAKDSEPSEDGSEDDDLEAVEEEDEEDEEELEDEEVPTKKKAKVSVEGSSKKTKKGDDSDDSYVDDPEAAETVAGLSGDEVDPNLILPGGRRTRRGRASSVQQYTYTAGGEDSDDSF